MKMLRKITALTVSLVLICLLGISVSAASYSYSEPFDIADEVFVTADLSQLVATGTIDLVCQEDLGNYLRIDVTSTFQEVNRNEPTTRDYVNEVEFDSYCDIVVRYDTSTVEKIYSATFSFFARFGVYYGGGRGPYEFSEGPVTLRNR